MGNEMKNFALLGYKLSHSISHVVHNKRFSEINIDANYVIDDVVIEELKTRLRQYDGVNVTIPYKQSVVPFLDSLSEEARTIGSVNTVLNTDGKLIGYNTDIAGFKYIVDKVGANLSGRVLILGNGGVAQTVIYLTLLCGGDVVVASRKKCASSKNIKFIDYNTANNYFCDVVINCTPVGMYPNIDETPVCDLHCKYYIDLIYNPLKTRLSEIAETKGIKSIGGMDMLIVQALESEKIWLGLDYGEDDIERMAEYARGELG